MLVAAKVRAEPGDESKGRRLLLRAKSNIGADDGGFAYALERAEVAPDVEGPVRPLVGSPAGIGARVAWRMLKPDTDADDGDGAGSAAAWLRELLAHGPVAAGDVKRFADEAGYSWRTMQRAMRKAGADSRRSGFGKASEWFLKPSSATVAPVAPHARAGATGATGGATDDAAVI